MAVASFAPNAPWRKAILQQLESRDKRERDPFESVILTCASLFEKIDTLQREKALSTGVDPSSTAPIEIVVKIQNELKDCQEQSSNKDGIISELNAKLSVLTKEKTDLKAKHSDLVFNYEAMKTKCESLKESVCEIQNQLTLVNDEHTALQMAYNSLKKKYDMLNEQHNSLTSKLLAIRTKDAELMNQENEKMIKLQSEKNKKNLEERAKAILVPESIKKEMETIPNDEKEVFKHFYSILPNKPYFSFDTQCTEINAIKFNPQTSHLTSGGADRKVKIWELEVSKANLLETLPGSNAGVTSIDIFEDFLVASSNDLASRVWTISDYRLRRTLTGHSNHVKCVKFFGVQNKVVSGSHDKTLKIWDLNRWTCIRTLCAGSTCNDLVNINKNDTVIASAHHDKKIRFWDVRTDCMQPTDILLQGKISSLDVTHDNRYLLCSIRTIDMLKCFDLRMNQVLRDYSAESFVIGTDNTRLKLSPDNRLVACGGNEANVFVWDFMTSKLEKSLITESHSGAVVSVEWHPKGELFVSADRNKNIVVWH